MANLHRITRNRVSRLAASLSLVGALVASSPAFGAPPAYPGARGVPFQVLQGQINDLAAALAAVQAQITALQAEVQALQVQVASNTASIQELQAWRQATDELIGALMLRVTLLEQQVQLNTQDIAAIRALDQAQNELIAQLQSSVSFLQTQVNTNTDAIRFLIILAFDQQRLIDAIRSQIASLQSQISMNAGDITTLNFRINSLQAQVSSLQSQLASKQNRIFQACAPGSSIRQINFDGSVFCEVDDVTFGGGTLNAFTVSVGSGLIFPGQTRSVSAPCFFPNRLVGGGHAYSFLTNTVINNLPSGDSWFVAVRNDTGSFAFMTVFARCARVL